MLSLRVACAGLLLLAACASSNKSAAPARQAQAAVRAEQGPLSYGFRPEDPVRVGWGNRGVMTFLELLRGPDGQRVAWRRVGTCCGAEAAMEVFEVTYEGLDEPVRLYLDPHHGDAIHAPAGFIIEGLTSREPRDPEQLPEVIEL
ncbi:MAG TPA: fibril protein [Myxococcus sp.]|nr:fibril protein [Myxococcus sp.]